MLKDAPPEEIAAALSIVASGDALLAPAVTRAVIEEFTRTQPAGPPAPPAPAPTCRTDTPRARNARPARPRALQQRNLRPAS